MIGPAGDALVLFGITGDLSRKMILPALYRLAERGQLTVPVVGVSRSAGDPDEVRKLVTASVEEALDTDADDTVLDALLDRVHTVTGNCARTGRRSTGWPSCCGSWSANTRSPSTTWQCRRHRSSPLRRGSPRSG